VHVSVDDLLEAAGILDEGERTAQIDELHELLDRHLPALTDVFQAYAATPEGVEGDKAAAHSPFVLSLDNIHALFKACNIKVSDMVLREETRSMAGRDVLLVSAEMDADAVSAAGVTLDEFIELMVRVAVRLTPADADEAAAGAADRLAQRVRPFLKDGIIEHAKRHPLSLAADEEAFQEAYMEPEVRSTLAQRRVQLAQCFAAANQRTRALSVAQWIAFLERCGAIGAGAPNLTPSISEHILVATVLTESVYAEAQPWMQDGEGSRVAGRGRGSAGARSRTSPALRMVQFERCVSRVASLLPAAALEVAPDATLAERLDALAERFVLPNLSAIRRLDTSAVFTAPAIDE